LWQSPHGTGWTNLLSGIVHLVLLATYIFAIFAPLSGVGAINRTMA
jgi:Ca2+/H+ antiporter